MKFIINDQVVLLRAPEGPFSLSTLSRFQSGLSGRDTRPVRCGGRFGSRSVSADGLGAGRRYPGDPGTCSKQRHTTRQHPIEGRICYPSIRDAARPCLSRQYADRGTDLVVIPQPDGSVA